jgi:hypothetical protein
MLAALGGLLRGRLLGTDRGAQCIHHRLPRAIVSPLRKVFIDGALGKPIMWQHVPLAPRAVEVQAGVDDFAHVYGSRAPAGLRRWNKRLQELLLIICQVSQIGFASRGSHWRDLHQNWVISMTTIC